MVDPCIHPLCGDPLAGRGFLVFGPEIQFTSITRKSLLYRAANERQDVLSIEEHPTYQQLCLYAEHELVSQEEGPKSPISRNKGF